MPATHLSPGKIKQMKKDDDKVVDPPSRPNPFTPYISYYKDRNLVSAGNHQTSTICKKCVVRDSGFVQPADWEIEEMKTNLKFSTRRDTCCLDMSKVSARPDI